MQQMLKTPIRSDDDHESIFDAVRDTISKEAHDRRRFEGAEQGHMRPIVAPAGPVGQIATPPARTIQQRAARVTDIRQETTEQAKPPLVSKSTRRKKSARQYASKRLVIVAGVGAWGGAMMLFYPFVGLVLAVLAFSFCAISYLILGYDGFWLRVMRPLRLYVARHPERAADVYARIDRFAVRWDAVLDRLPERMVAALYLPDISDLAAVAEQDRAKIDLRLSSLGAH